MECLVTLTDLQTRRAGLSASAELLVRLISQINVSDKLLQITVLGPHSTTHGERD